MKINFELLRTVEPIAFEELQTLRTGSLLTRLKRLRALQESFEVSDWLPEERDAVEAAWLIAFKETAVWKDAWSDIKRILDNREHLPRGSKELRQEAERNKRRIDSRHGLTIGRCRRPLSSRPHEFCAGDDALADADLAGAVGGCQRDTLMGQFVQKARHDGVEFRAEVLVVDRFLARLFDKDG